MEYSTVGLLGLDWGTDTKPINPDHFTKTGKAKSKETINEERLCSKILNDFADDFAVHLLHRAVTNGQLISINFRLPMPPSLNRWTRVWRGKAHASKAAKAYKSGVEEAMESWSVRPSLSKFSVHLRLYGLPDGSDVDGRSKQLLDALQGTVVHNDYQFKKLTAEDMETPENQGSYVEILIEKRAL